MQQARSWTRWVVLATLALGCPPVVAAPALVADLYPGDAGLPVGPDPAGSFEHGGVGYLPATDAQQGTELWRTDGTAPATYRVTDICPGVCDGNPSILGFFDGWIYLTADDGEHGDALWRTDGTPDREELVQGVCDGACLAGLEQAQAWRGALWFLVAGAHDTPVLWTSDLTAGGTHAVADLCADLGICGLVAGSEASLSGPDPSGQGLVLWVYTSPRADSLLLLRTDGTAPGTVLLHRFQSFSLAPFSPPAAPAGSPLFFADGSDLWTSDGTAAGTHLVRSLDGMVMPVSDFEVRSQEVVDGVWYGIFDLSGEWLRSDGTAGGTVVLGNFLSDFNPTVARVGSAALAVTDEGAWSAGTTAATTVKVVDWQSEGVLGVVEQAHRVFVLLWIGSGGTVWATDGTAAGTRRVKFPSGPPVDQYSMAAFGGGVLVSRGGDQLWSVDATATRALLLHDFQPADGPSLTPGGAVLDDRLLFYARTSPATASLFSSDGTGARTTAVTAAADEAVFGLPPGHLFTRFGGNQVLFDAAGHLWVTDGSAHGTRQLSRQVAYLFPYSYSPVATIGGGLVFAGHVAGGPLCDPGQTEPWVTDGVPGRAHEILDLNPYFYPGGGSQCEDLPFSSAPGPGISFGAAALFAADDLVHGRELFVTDGTAAGTRLVADINRKTVPNTVTAPPGVPPLVGEGSDPSDFVALGSRVVFVADDGTTGRQLWITNGTARGTRRVANPAAGAEGSTPHDLVAWRGEVYYVARHGQGEGLFRSDGTAAGTVLVSGLELAGLPTRAGQLLAVGDRLFFAGFNESTGTELWTSAGTPATTRLVADLRPGVRGSAPQNLTAVGGVLLFAADDGATGLEPWRSDGTAAGTFPLGDIAPGMASSTPGPFWVVGDRVLFGADDGEHGRELWSMPIGDVVRGSASR